MVENQNKTAPPNRLAEDGGYKGKTILITGATGLLGTVLLEKILRTCHLVKNVYVIIRSKKGITPQDRLKESFNGPIFDLLKKTRGEEILEKVIAIDGDISELNLGLSPENWKLLAKEVQIIFHVAATVRFDEPLKAAILLNVRGTKLLLDLAKECKKLLVFAHVSTAYSHPHEKVLYEKTYPPPANPYDIIKIIELLDDKVIASIAATLKGDSPNTYTYTKALGEGVVNNEMDNLPVIILRPSIVIPILRDPIRGWTNNLGGPVGVLVCAGKGILRSIYGNPDSCSNFMPVDMTCNAILIDTYDYMINRTRRVFNITSYDNFKLTWKEVTEIAVRVSLNRLPLNWVIWYPTSPMVSSKWLHNIYVVLLHYIPAIILDSLIILSGNKPTVWKIQQKITKGSDQLSYYTENQWEFNLDASFEARALLNETELDVYKVNDDDIDIEEYTYHCAHGARLYLLKESDESIPTAKRHLKVMWAVDKLCKFLMLIGFVYLLLKNFIFPVLGIES